MGETILLSNATVLSVKFIDLSFDLAWLEKRYLLAPLQECGNDCGYFCRFMAGDYSIRRKYHLRLPGS